MTTAVNGPWFDVPAGTRPSECRSCKATVFWIETDYGKRMPVDCDVAGGYEPGPRSPRGDHLDGHGVSHFSTCPDADTWRKR